MIHIRPPLLLMTLAVAAVAGHGATRGSAAVYRSPCAIVAAPDGKTLYVSDKTAGCVVVHDAAAGKKVREIPIPGQPAGMALSADGKTLYVAERLAGCVAVIDTERGGVTGRISVGPWPVAVTIAPKGNRLYVCDRGDHTVAVVDLATRRLLKQVAVVRDPVSAAITPDETRVVVANYMPQGAGNDPTLAAEVSILDATALEPIARVKLPPGSTGAAGVCLSPDGKWAYVVHAIGRFNVPITQLERGWAHTYALSILDVPAGSLAATVLLDDLTRGAADPSGILGSPDGKRLWISHAGTHEVSLVDVGLLHELLAGKVPASVASLKDGMRDNVWVRISQDRKVVGELVNDLTALYFAGVIRRAGTGGMGPRGLTLSPDGQKLYAANYFSGTIGVLDAIEGKLLATLTLGEQPSPDAARRGEIYFHDATRCFQSWHSCASCHLDDGRVDGLPWDFLRDGLGNPKDVISLVYMQHTSPHNRRATRPDPHECMRTGVTGSHLVVPTAADVDDLVAYAASLRPEPNPLLPKLAEAAARGKVVFEGKAACAGCHPAPYFTDQKMHNVGILTAVEPDGRYKTPSLIEAYRTAPYYHDGRAATMKDALTKHDPEGRHGNLRTLTLQEIDDLVAYVLSL
jgi:YVTN family beta-propeller protein